jgi:pyridinium-3,5-bisthiocarboxylic acid mononucleotide nickel chelatase
VSVAFFEMVGGASGNMLLGSLVDAGANPGEIEAALRTISLSGWSVELRRTEKRGIAATYIDFVIPGDHGGGLRRLADVLELLERSALTDAQKARSASIYVRLAQAEAKVHGTTVEEGHFHEVGATDAILDVAGCCVALDLLGIEESYCSAYPVGRGTLSIHHGRYPNPPPATAELMRGAPSYDAGIEAEMVTPTGAAILSTLVREPGVRPPMRTGRIGYGAGRSDFSIPNVVRVSIGPLASERSASGDVVVLEATIDDMSPQHFELAIERVLAAGAYDVWLAPVTMKKLRPAVLFGAVASPERESEVAHAMLTETSTLGVRVRTERRYTLPRNIETHETPLGTVRVKVAAVDGQARRTLEYDDVARIARQLGRPIADVAAQLGEYVNPR